MVCCSCGLLVWFCWMSCVIIVLVCDFGIGVLLMMVMFWVNVGVVVNVVVVIYRWGDVRIIGNF